MPRYRVSVAPRFPQEGQRGTEFVLDTSDEQTEMVYGSSAQAIAHTVGGEYCDSGGVTVQNVRDGSDHFSISMRS